MQVMRTVLDMAMESGPARLAMIVAAISFAQVRVGAILRCRIIPGNLFNECQYHPLSKLVLGKLASAESWLVTKTINILSHF